MISAQLDALGNLRATIAASAARSIARPHRAGRSATAGSKSDGAT